jgi:L-cysteine/cystine lyase
MAAEERRALERGRFGHAFFVDVMNARGRLRDELGRLIGAGPESIALTTSTTEGCNTVVSGLALGPEDEVVTTDSEHPGLLGALRVSGARVRVAPVSEAPAAEAAATVRREVTDATRLVAVSHVVWTTGQVVPIGELAPDGVPVLVDGAQSVGAIPVDVGELGCDFYTVSGQKWLLGPDATGGLYVRRDWHERLAITSPSYLCWEKPATLEPWPDARRFESSWTPPASVAGLLASVELAREVGDDRFAQARAMTERCRELVAARADVVTEADQATLVSFRPVDPAAEVVRRLDERSVVVRDLPGLDWVRASCGFWTNDEDLERLVGGL